MTEICSSSREPKWAKTPDLLICVTSASAPMDRPSTPICVARPSAASTIAALVCWPFCMARPSRGARPFSGKSDTDMAPRIKRTVVLFCRKSGRKSLPTRSFFCPGCCRAGSTGGRLGDASAEIGRAHVVVRPELGRLARHREPAGFQHVAAIGDRERHARVLLDEEHGGAAPADLADDGKHLLHDHRCEPE